MAAELIPRRPVHTTAFKCTIGAVEAYLCTSGYQNDKKHTSRREVYPLLSNVLVFFYFVFFFIPKFRPRGMCFCAKCRAMAARTTQFFVYRHVIIIMSAIIILSTGSNIRHKNVLTKNTDLIVRIITLDSVNDLVARRNVCDKIL